MKIFPSSSIKKLDAYTIEHEPIASIDLMERAAQALTKAITERWDITTPVTVFAGPGNNGGDALAVARMLAEKEYKVEAYLFNPKGELSADCQTNKELVEMMKETNPWIFYFLQMLNAYLYVFGNRQLLRHGSASVRNQNTGDEEMQSGSLS
jgi:NAD(P)H-hydrate repair Nnr-like enzyme with NAD(P)H-hydrate epimerase domain